MPEPIANADTRECPFCKEEIKAAAVKCKHCGSAVQPLSAEHGGTCPYCKESIQPGAIVCKHCKSSLVGGRALESAGRPFMAGGPHDCNCKGSYAGELAAMERMSGGRPDAVGGDLNVNEGECL